MKVQYLVSLALALTASSALAQSTPKAAVEAGRPGKILSQDECSKLWSEAAGRGDLSPEQAKQYITNFEQVDKNSDNKITNGEFQAGCKLGFVQHAAADSGAATPGSTSKE